jgi:ABC-2 type transport system ATP-binding protein
MKILMSLTFPTSGAARILGADIADVRVHRRIGYLPERPYFYDYLTAREFLEYCAELFGYRREERKRRAAEMLRRVFLDERSWDKQMRRYSKGMLQRVGLAQALVNNPEVVFLDEPMSGLDPIGRREVRDLIAGLRAHGTTVFFCSHILSDIETLCDRAGVMRKGKLHHLGTIEELRELGTDGRMEIIFAGGDVEAIRRVLAGRNDVEIAATPNGARLIVENEQAVDNALPVLRASGARLISINALGNSLEELFKDEAKPEMHDA